ncbi:programmed cell death protein 4 [Leptidea sinapis]|uniref:programmed cell death protein 4 n=1 Tax=Leptidea sinapis TaxID=189913 RepID=UPI0021374613|nr:programmed cell death protein 4 [Leptidea sinapis]
MDVERIASDSENVAVDENEKSIAEVGAGDAVAASHSGKLRRKSKKFLRTNSKEGANAVAHPLPKFRSWKNSRRPRNGHGRGLPKKGGAGGKGVWGAPGSEMLDEYEEDANDPNYDSEAVTNGDVIFKEFIVEADPEEVVRKCEPVILEYFEHGDTNEAAEDFLEFVTPNRTHLVVETIVEVALDHKPSHCEMASVLISDLYGRVCSAKDIAYAFERLLERLADLQLDTPDAPVMLSNFIARCVADDCLPPSFVTGASDRQHLSPLASQSLSRADTLLSMKQGMVRLDNIWGVGGGIRPVKSLIRQIQLLLKEYLTSGDLAEAMRCMKELEVPHFHHELVYETVLLALEAINTGVEEQLSTFLAELRRCVLLTPDQMDRGFLRVLEDMSDIVLDVPLAYIMLDRFVERCQQKFRLGDHVLKRMPTRGRKRFVSEGDGGIIKDHALKLRE